MIKHLDKFKVAFLFVSLFFAIYIPSVLWRVSRAEQVLYGRSMLLPAARHQKKYSEPPTPDSFNSATYRYLQDGKEIVVYSQLINGFQHTYGSALAAYELGNKPADWLFRANEYMEAIFCKNSGTIPFYMDTKKDLANNKVGREIGREAKHLGLTGKAAETYMKERVLAAISYGDVYKHWQDSRVQELPTLRKYGCPLLAQIQTLRSTDKSLRFR